MHSFKWNLGQLCKIWSQWSSVNRTTTNPLIQIRKFVHESTAKLGFAYEHIHMRASASPWIRKNSFALTTSFSWLSPFRIWWHIGRSITSRSPSPVQVDAPSSSSSSFSLFRFSWCVHHLTGCMHLTLIASLLLHHDDAANLLVLGLLHYLLDQ